MGSLDKYRLKSRYRDFLLGASREIARASRGRLAKSLVASREIASGLAKSQVATREIATKKSQCSSMRLSIIS